MPLGETAAVRIVGYGTHFGGFIDAVGPAGEENVNDGERIGGRVSLLWQPTPELKITPRIVYQVVEANGSTARNITSSSTISSPRRRRPDREAQAVSELPREIPRQDVPGRPRSRAMISVQPS